MPLFYIEGGVGKAFSIFFRIVVSWNYFVTLHSKQGG